MKKYFAAAVLASICTIGAILFGFPGIKPITAILAGGAVLFGLLSIAASGKN
jgi:hypothetical protein